MPYFGQLMGIRTALAEINGKQGYERPRQTVYLYLISMEIKVELYRGRPTIEIKETEASCNRVCKGETAVVLDTNPTPELIEEGFGLAKSSARYRPMRKEAGFEVMDKIRVSVKKIT